MAGLGWQVLGASGGRGREENEYSCVCIAILAQGPWAAMEQSRQGEDEGTGDRENCIGCVQSEETQPSLIQVSGDGNTWDSGAEAAGGSGSRLWSRS